jgi:hypothetical protein
MMTDILLEEKEIPMPANVPEKFRDPATGAIRTEALLQSYLELEKRLSASLPMPQSDDDKLRLTRLLGCPESPDAYEVDCSHGLFEADSDINSRLHQHGLTNKQVQAVYDLAAEKFVPMMLEFARDFQADREVERLVDAFGGNDKFQEISRQLLAYGKQNLPPDVLASLASSYEGVMALYRLMQGQEPGIALSRETAGGANVPNETELRGMMRDPRYWRDKEPGYVAQVTSGFKSLYGA